MPYKDPNAQREYQNRWMKQRRQDWLAEHGPCIDCGTWDNLEVDHIDPTRKITHRVWSWTLERREAELIKCVARCELCHMKKTKHQTLFKRYCIKGHDTWATGRDNRSRCVRCRQEFEYPERNKQRRGV